VYNGQVAHLVLLRNKLDRPFDLRRGSVEEILRVSDHDGTYVRHFDALPGDFQPDIEDFRGLDEVWMRKLAVVELRWGRCSSVRNVGQGSMPLSFAEEKVVRPMSESGFSLLLTEEQ
jgi:hypothetical protein